jgi:UDP-N-acetylmuramoyl-L-alanyl-D-glutamate--2,6-diaminopimelate ligase
MEAYFAAKASLFTADRARRAVVNGDDRWGQRLLDQISIPAVVYRSTDVTGLDSRPGRTSFVWHDRRVELALTGWYHVANALAAATTASALGISDGVVVEGLARAATVTGRFEVVHGTAPFTVVVDYAHTPDGLAVALDSARRLADGHRVLCVFGCGGDRDRAKRPLMGAVAAAGADVVVVTSDNSRHEDPAAIMADVVAGIADPAVGADLIIEADRGAAIAAAVGSAAPGDVVLVAGKGHETVIEIGDERIPFDDRAVAAAALHRLVP